MIIVTHDGKFHPDDVLSVATLLLPHPKANIIRTRDIRLMNSANIVVDVGGQYDPENGYFDHHQRNFDLKRENGIPYSSFGLVWKKYGMQICNDAEVATEVDRVLVQPIDADDNVIEVNEDRPIFTLSDALSIFEPTATESNLREDLDKAFKAAVNFAQAILKRVIAHAEITIKHRQQVLAKIAATDDKRIIVFQSHIEWEETIIANSPETFYVVYPDKTGTWRVKCVRKNLISFENRKDLPRHWAGLSGRELEEASGVEGALFAHKNGYMCKAETLHDALNLANVALSTT